MGFHCLKFFYIYIYFLHLHISNFIVCSIAPDLSSLLVTLKCTSIDSGCFFSGVREI